MDSEHDDYIPQPMKTTPPVRNNIRNNSQIRPLSNSAPPTAVSVPINNPQPVISETDQFSEYKVTRSGRISRAPTRYNAQVENK